MQPGAGADRIERHHVRASPTGTHRFTDHDAPSHGLLGVDLARLSDQHEGLHRFKEWKGAVILKQHGSGRAEVPGNPTPAFDIEGSLYHGALIYPQAKLLGVAALQGLVQVRLC